MSKKFTFPVGYHDFHKDQVFNFQLNRWYSFGYARFEDMQEAGGRIESFADWKREMTRLAEKAVAEKRPMNAAFYYRAAEFYTFEGDPDKDSLYDKFSDLFYRVFRDDIKRFKVPYKKTFLPAMEVSPVGGKAKGTIVMFGGFDSYIEEFYSWMRCFADHGYRVVTFEGNHPVAVVCKASHPGVKLLDIRVESAEHDYGAFRLASHGRHLPCPQERLLIGDFESFDVIPEYPVKEVAELIVQSFLIRVSFKSIELSRPVIKRRIHQPLFGNGFFRQLRHFPLPVRKTFYSPTGFLHVFKSGVAEGVPAVQLEIEQLVFMESVVSDRECEFTL